MGGEDEGGPGRELGTGPVELRDGSTVDVRPMRSEDAGRLVRFADGLSPHTAYLRFFGVHRQLQDAEIRRFANVDHHDREAIVAMVDDEIVGVARFDRADGDEAEVAFVVADRWQGRGLGTALFGLLAQRARSVGVSWFVAETLPQNRRMLALLHHAGLPLRAASADGIVRLTIHLTPAG